MKLGPASIIDLFKTGEFSLVLEHFENASALKNDKSLIPFRIGALVFTGETQKALALFNKTTLTLPQTVAARFFLAIGYIRQSQYSQGRALLIENRKALPHLKKKEGHFYIYQGLAFYRFFRGQFHRSKKDAERAYSLAVEQDYPFGEMISKDLLAHSLVQVGQVRHGLKYFEDNLKHARKSKNQMAASIEISILKFRAQFGIEPETDLDRLVAALEVLSPQDTYSTAELLLEMIRQHLLRGQFTQAEAALAKTSDIVYKHQNRRQMALLNIRMGYMLYLQGQHTQALHVIRFSEQNIDHDVDLSLSMQIGGLKEIILKAQGKIPEATSLHRDLQKRHPRIQNAVNYKILSRHEGSAKRTIGEDPLGDLLDQIQQQSPEAGKNIVRTKYYGLLHKYYKLPFGTQALIFDLLPGSVIILDKGNVTLKKKGINSMMRKILLMIRQEPQTKEQLIQNIWGYNYDPLRHDPLIYSTINKIRKVLGLYGDWILLTEQGYVMKREVKVIFKNSLKTSTKAAQKKTKALVVTASERKRRWDDNFKHLNFRQIQIVDYLKVNPSLSISELSEHLDISKPTATRDLSHLFKLGILKRAGKGRATRYFIF